MRWLLAIFALLGAGLCALGWHLEAGQFFRSWWLAWIFWAGVALGGVPITALHFLTGGRWGGAARRSAEAAMLALPLLALLFLPAAYGLPHIFPWAQPGYFGESSPHKAAYLTPHGFLLRTGTAFSLLILLSFFLRIFSKAHAFRPSANASIRSGLGALSALVWVFCLNFLSTDWVMSLEPQWHSTIFSVILMASQFLSALALCVMTAATAPELTQATLRDLGNLLLAFVIFWTYVSFSQFLIIWSGNLPREIAWYVHRRNGHWPFVAQTLAIVQFALPFALLLSRASKHHPQRLRVIAILIFISGVLNIYWLLVPSWHPEGVTIHWLDPAAFLTIGAVFLCGFHSALARLPREVPHA